MVFTGPKEAAGAKHGGVAGGQSSPEEHQERDEDTIHGWRQEDGCVIVIISIVFIEANHSKLPQICVIIT
jgi:hypothetical protein